MQLDRYFLADLDHQLRHERPRVLRLLHRVQGLGRRLLLRSDLLDQLEALCRDDGECALADSPLGAILGHTQEAVLEEGWVYLALRLQVARWSYLRVHLDTLAYEQIPVADFLCFKERLTGAHADEWVLEVDLEPFSREFAKLRESRSIGHGVEFLNRRLSSRLFELDGGGDRELLRFLRVHRWGSRQLMLNDAIDEVSGLRQALRAADELLGGRDPATSWSEIAGPLQRLGFEAGWGRDSGRVRDTMQLLLDILEAPSAGALEDFLGRVPMIFSVAILSPHGWFGQDKVLGRPDTGGQVVYILDQVRALEQEMCRRNAAQGLDIPPRILVVTRLIPEADGTSCDQRLEPVAGTRNAFIFRVPFHDEQGVVVSHWISRFAIWPYLERFVLDVERELLAELGGRPDLLIGNYSDGNLVATLLAQRMGVTQCNIAHALEKTKYLYSDLYWRDNEEQYHFSCQFTADLIAMNAADFIITSTYQEIAGTATSVGQYEAHATFTMPGLYRVVHGIDVFDPKFNIVSPGADPEVYFPFDQEHRRLRHLAPDIERLIDGRETAHDIRGVLSDIGRPLLFTMARMDRIKNITGLVEWYARSPGLRDEVNLLIVSGHVDPERSGDAEERGQIERMHGLMDQYGLDGEVRWLGMHLDKGFAGELYRAVADRRGAFVQPALFEAFGLTVIEAMSSGLPTFATCFGGPLEIIVDSRSGFHLDPNHGEQAAQRMADFFARCRREPGHWDELSQGGLQRVAQRYTWARYAERLMTLSRVYGFWKYVTDLNRAETRRYLQMFYALQFRPLAQSVPH